LGDILIAQKGSISTSYSEEKCANYMKQKEIIINLHLGKGKQKATIHTCDFSYDYVKINASYRS
jgi:glutamate N-acetyltransferase/amino-acid N-acetyltransferase